MATSMASDTPSLVLDLGEPDPFVSAPKPATHRFSGSGLDAHSFALGPGASPASAKCALEAHLADTNRRMKEAGKLGTALVEQRKELEERLKEVEQLEAEDELSPELRTRLMAIEKDFNEVAQESARAFLPKQRASSNEPTTGMPFTPDKNAVRRSVSPSKFESLATGSPSKFGAANRKMRHQPANRIHDIEFATEISTSLITQVRNLQGLLQERERELKDARNDKSSLEQEVESFQQRMRNMGENESRYKDENWNLETQVQELMAAQKEAVDREKKLANSLNILLDEKNSTQRELDEIKTVYSRLGDEHAAAIKHHDIELGIAKRNAVMAEGQRAAMQRKIDELNSQNQELAKAIALERGRTSPRNSPVGSSEEDMGNAGGRVTPEHSPPPSPIKPTPRHSMLESETLKTSLQHAQRTIQSLRTNVHREKTEKLELKRLLQDARDEIEKLRSDPVERPHHRRAREAKPREFKKPPKLDKLGSSRVVKAEILHLEDPDWEEIGTQRGSPPMTHSSRKADNSLSATGLDSFETANEANKTTDAFEAAHERGTETEDFQTGPEDFSAYDTEIESPSRLAVMRANALRGAPVMAASQEFSYESTASTSASDDEGDYNGLTRTPTSPQKMRLRASRGALSRRSRQVSEGASLQDSPATNPNSSFNGPNGMPRQSLFAELNELEASDGESVANTPGQRSLRSVTPGSTSRGQTTSRTLAVPALPAIPSVITIDSGTMTEPVDVQPISVGLAPVSAVPSQRPKSIDSVVSVFRARPLSLSDSCAQHDPDIEERIALFPAPPTTPPSIGAMPTPRLLPPQRLAMSTVYVEEIEPWADTQPEPEPSLLPVLEFSTMVSEQVQPIPEPKRGLPILSMSSVVFADVEPIADPEVLPPAPPNLRISPIIAKHVEPVAELETPIPPPPILTFSSLSMAEVESVEEPEHERQIVRVMEYVQAPTPPPASLVFSELSTAEVEPMAEPGREQQVVRVVEYVEVPRPPPAGLAFSPLFFEDVEPQAEPERPLPQLTFASMKSEQVEPRTEFQQLPPPLSISSIVMEDVEPKAERQPALSVSVIASEHIVPNTESERIPPRLFVSQIISEQIEPVEAVSLKAGNVAIEKPQPLSLAHSLIQSLDTEPAGPESPVLGEPPLPPLGVSAIRSLDIEPIPPRIPKRDGLIIPHDEEGRPMAVGEILGSSLGRGRAREPQTPIIAEDETRQSPRQSLSTGTPESQRPLQEISANGKTKPTFKEKRQMSESGTQTSLTAEAIDQMIYTKNRQLSSLAHQKSDSFASVSSTGTPGTVRVQRSQESVSRPPRYKSKIIEPFSESVAETALYRSGSAANTRPSAMNAPPLPPNHKEAIEAARTSTASSGYGTIGSMGPPLIPASAYKNSMTRPRTPVSTTSKQPNVKGTPTPRPERMNSAHGTAHVHSPTRLAARSRRSSVSSFASEVDSRFQGIGGLGMDSHGFGPNTDPRMIQAITQTMIGEYLWKYTRKAGRGGMSENRHRRYFWVHPYTRTLYWSERDPTNAGKSELRAKSVPIEAVRVVTDDNPMPPGLHRKSLIIISPGRSIKFTCTTGQRHETWFNALSYLLLRNNNDGQADTEEMVNGITREDVDEFNPQYGRRAAAAGAKPRPPPSISSHNSQGTRSISAVNLDVPTLTALHRKTDSSASVARLTFTGRLSGYWKSTHESFISMRSRNGVQDRTSLYENDEAHDSAEELRLMYERQDRESHRLDNVRACCEGKHDVSTLRRKKGSRQSRYNDHASVHSHPSRASTPGLSSGTVRSRA